MLIRCLSKGTRFEVINKNVLIDRLRKEGESNLKLIEDCENEYWAMRSEFHEMPKEYERLESKLRLCADDEYCRQKIQKQIVLLKKKDGNLRTCISSMRNYEAGVE